MAKQRDKQQPTDTRPLIDRQPPAKPTIDLSEGPGIAHVGSAPAPEQAAADEVPPGYAIPIERPPIEHESGDHAVQFAPVPAATGVAETMGTIMGFDRAQEGGDRTAVIGERPLQIIQTAGSRALDGVLECGPGSHIWSVNGEQDTPAVGTPCDCTLMHYLPREAQTARAYAPSPQPGLPAELSQPSVSDVLRVLIGDAILDPNVEIVRGVIDRYAEPSDDKPPVLFVIDVNRDPHAATVLRVYAERCQFEHPELAKRLLDLVGIGAQPVRGRAPIRPPAKP